MNGGQNATQVTECPRAFAATAARIRGVEWQPPDGVELIETSDGSPPRIHITGAPVETDIYLPRREYIGGVVFNDPSAWIGGKTPNFTSDGFVRGSGGIAVAQTSMQFQNLSVFDAWNVTALQTNVLLDVAGTTTIDGSNTTNGSTKIVLQGSSSPGSLGAHRPVR